MRMCIAMRFDLLLSLEINSSIVNIELYELSLAVKIGSTLNRISGTVSVFARHSVCNSL